jgi:hypothetical protein
VIVSVKASDLRADGDPEVNAGRWRRRTFVGASYLSFQLNHAFAQVHPSRPLSGIHTDTDAPGSPRTISTWPAAAQASRSAQHSFPR